MSSFLPVASKKEVLSPLLAGSLQEGGVIPPSCRQPPRRRGYPPFLPAASKKNKNLVVIAIRLCTEKVVWFNIKPFVVFLGKGAINFLGKKKFFPFSLLYVHILGFHIDLCVKGPICYRASWQPGQSATDTTYLYSKKM
ncbi:hypothetical protein AVEN_175688-1 [Araneus ventricosus]|uniref:Uncharacterized protein n=1 Tax=Araneus ventricosus TaxID=182803 RepID=A0A4Y2EX71_ARAVE|nr:hypothetical protein AVEN_175688-1 [Araneus ventricosus]